MVNSKMDLLLVGDNPFHGISHLSQERARSRRVNDDSAAKADIVLSAVKSGANGFMFSVSDVTLSILKALHEQGGLDEVGLYAIVPYAYEYVRIAAQTGTPGLVRRVAKQVAMSGDVAALFRGLGAVVRFNPEGFLKTYLAYEISRIRSSGDKVKLSSLLLHEVITDMGLALNLKWLFKSYISYLSKREIAPGFNTRNFPYLLRKFRDWQIELKDIYIATQFNKAGFQMNPSREECENALASLTSPIVLAISVMAAGYFKPSEAVEYLVGQNNLKGFVAGVSSTKQAIETFTIFRDYVTVNGIR
jgi:hypothetical protein